MKTLTKAVLTSLIILLSAVASFAQQGQNSITQTTLSAAVSGPAGYSGTSPTISGTVTLAACTGILAPTLPGTPVSVIYVGREAMGILTGWNSTGCSGPVLRGYLGTQAAPHPSGDMVLIAPTYNTTAALGANPVPSGFYNVDPPIGSTCNAGTPTNIWVNVLTGAQWICSTITSTFVPGFQNPWITDSAYQTTTVAAAAGTVTPSGPLFVISGSGAITGFNIPVGCNATAVGGCAFTVISATGSTWTWTNAGNILLGGTGTANHSFTFVWVPSLQKFVASAIV